MRSSPELFRTIEEAEAFRLPTLIKRLLTSGSEEERLLALLRTAVRNGDSERVLKLAGLITEVSTEPAQLNQVESPSEAENCA